MTDNDGFPIKCDKCAGDAEGSSPQYAMLMTKDKRGNLLNPPQHFTLQSVRCLDCSFEWLLIDSLEDNLERWASLPRWEEQPVL